MLFLQLHKYYTWFKNIRNVASFRPLKCHFYLLFFFGIADM